MSTMFPRLAVLAAAAMLLAPPALRGRVSGLLVSGIFIGQFLSPIVSQPLITASGYGAAYAMVGAVVLVFGIIAFAARLFRWGDG